MTTRHCSFQTFLMNNQRRKDLPIKDLPCGVCGRKCCVILLLAYLAFDCDDPEMTIRDIGEILKRKNN